MTEPTLDAATFARLLEITGDDIEFVDELVDIFLSDAEREMDALSIAAAADDAAAIVRPAHTLKSSSASVGALALAELCRALEADGRTGTVVDAVARAGACRVELAAVRAELFAARAAR